MYENNTSENICVEVFIIFTLNNVFSPLLLNKKTMKIGTPQVIQRKREFISVPLPPEYKSRLMKIAFDQDRSLSSLVRRQIEKLLADYENTKRT